MAQGRPRRTALSQAAGDARGMHSLAARLRPGPTVPGHDAIAAAARAVGLRVWHEPVSAASGEPAALARLRREARRPLAADAARARLVLLEYADGAADLVVVARRGALSARGLRALAERVLYGSGDAAAAPVEPGTTDGTDAPAGVAPPPEWGLGEPGSELCGEIEIPWPARPATRASLLAAAAICAAGHSGSTERGVALWSTGRGGSDPLVYPPVTREDSRLTVRELLQRYGADAASESEPGEPATGPLPSVGMLFEDVRDGEDYRPFLEPALPVVAHWRYAADGSVRGTLGYRRDAIAPEVARDFAAHIAHVLAQLAARPELSAGDIELLSREEAFRLVRSGATPAASPGPQSTAPATIHGLFAEVLDSRPDAVALTDEKTELTYAQLDARAERMARGLAALGADPGDKVAVALERGAEFVVVLLAILKAGCAYVPVDVRYPAQRVRYTVEDCGAIIAVGSPDVLAPIHGVRTVGPEELLAAAEAAGAARTPARPHPDPHADGALPAYVIYTSGSTGRPKGVIVPHRNVAALVRATRRGFGLGHRDTWTFFHSTAFDFSVWEIWGCLLTGGRLVVVPHWVARDTELFYDLVQRERVTVLSQTPSAFAQFVQTDLRRAGLAVPRLVVFGGEALDTGTLGPWFARHSATACRLINMFGITETTVHVTEQALTPAEVAAGSRSVGRALPGWSVSVRDERGRVLPAGAAGEIHVGGAGVAIGYLNRPGLTAERFVADPLTGARLYRSGDLGRLRPDGRLDHLGRIDSQVKIRGHRVELDEIRGVLLGHPAVAAAAVVLRQTVAGDRDTARLDAYYVAREGVPLGPGELAEHAARTLPEYMLPATLTPIDAIPLTVNGKADVAALPEPAAADVPHGAEPEPPRAAAQNDPIAAAVLALWSRLLRTDAGLDDNFFRIGGNSLMVVRVLRELADQGFPRVSVQDFYRNSDARGFIRILRESREPASA
jgi:amino acid adenylation domain-containing protein